MENGESDNTIVNESRLEYNPSEEATAAAERTITQAQIETQIKIAEEVKNMGRATPFGRGDHLNYDGAGDASTIARDLQLSPDEARRRGL